MKLIDYQIQLIKFPSGKTREAITENEDGSYTIFIEKSLSHIEQRQEFLHALSHIIRQDFPKDDVNQIEKEAHSFSTNQLLNYYIGESQ